MHFKTSTLCAASSLVVLAGFMAVNLAGCGGGGGGGGIANPTSTPASVSVTFTVQLPTGADSGTIVLTQVGGTAASGVTKTLSGAGKATFVGVQPGFYDLIVTVKNKSGVTIQNYTVRSYQIVGTATNYVISNTSSALKVSGTLFSNPGNASTSNCGSAAAVITSRVRILVRDLDATKGNPIISQAVRNGNNNNDGTYTISVPYRPTTFIVELDQADDKSSPFAGKSALTTFTSDVTEVTGVDICANTGEVAPVPNPTPTLTPTTFATATPTGTLTPTATPTATATATATTAPTATPTATTAP